MRSFRKRLPLAFCIGLILPLALGSLRAAHAVDTTPTPVPTATPHPEPTATTVPVPTATPHPEPTATPLPEPTATPLPEPTATSLPEPTATPLPEPTATPQPTPIAYSGIFGHVALSTGDAVGHVAISIADDPTPRAYTNGDGQYQISHLTAGPYVVKAAKVGYKFAPTVATVSLPTSGRPSSPNAEINFVATQRKDLTISGVILDTGQQPVTGVSVVLSATGSDARTTKTSSNGSYSFSSLAFGSYVVTPSKYGFTFDPKSRSLTLPTTSGDVLPNGSANFIARPVPPPTRARIFGHVLDSNGVGVAGVGIFLGDGTVAVATTGSDGSYVTPSIAVGTYVVRPRKDGVLFTPAGRSVILPTTDKSTSPDAEANFVAATPVVAYSIKGTVKNAAGAGVGGVGIFVGDGSVALATTGSNGEYTLPNLKAGSYVLTPKLSGKTFDPTSRTVVLTSVAPTAEANFIATDKTYVIGAIVKTSSGVAVSGVTFTLGDGPTVPTTNNGSGTYYITGLAPGTYVVHPHLANTTFQPASATVTLPSTVGTWAPSAVVNFVASTQNVTTYTVAAVVKTSSGAAVSDVTFTLGDGPTLTTTNNGSGTYYITGLAAGTYVVHPHKAHTTFQPASITVTLPTTSGTGAPNAVINFTAAAEQTATYIIGAVVKLSSGEAVNGVTFTFGDGSPVTTTTNGQGTYYISGLAAGTYVVFPHLEHTTFQPTTATVTLPSTSGTGAPNAVRSFIATTQK